MKLNNIQKFFNKRIKRQLKIEKITSDILEATNTQNLNDIVIKQLLKSFIAKGETHKALALIKNFKEK